MDSEIAALMPHDTPEYMRGAWLDCMSWAISHPEMVAEFRAESGLKWTPGRTGIERMIDEATGADRAFIVAFIKWASVNVWGPMDAIPDDVVRDGSGRPIAPPQSAPAPRPPGVWDGNGDAREPVK